MPELITMASHRRDWNRVSAELSLVSAGYLIGQGTELT